MGSNVRDSQTVHFADCTLELQTAELRRNGDKIILQDQPFQILITLLENPGQLVTREELIKKLWPAGTFVDFDQSLNKAIARLRETLGDSAENPRFIETLPRKGYRFIASVESNGQVAGIKIELAHVKFAENSAGVATPSGVTREKLHSHGIWIVCLASLSVLTVALTIWLWQTSTKTGQQSAQIVIKQVTANAPGDPVSDVAMSRDGRYLAYTSVISGKMHILEIDTGDLRDLPAPDRSTPWGWFPDGGHLLVVRHGKRGAWKISILDGTYQQIVDDDVIVPTLSPDGHFVAFFNSNMDSLSLVGTDGSGTRRVLSLDSGFFGDLAWSPDNSLLLFTRWRSDGDWTIEACDLRGGHRTTTMLGTRTARYPPSLYWLPDRRVVYSVSNPDKHNFDLWTFVADTSTGTRLSQPTWLATGEGEWPIQIRADNDGRRLIYVTNAGNSAIHLADLRSKTPNTKRLTTENWESSADDWSRDSRAILYSSVKNNKSIIYSQDLDGQIRKALISGDESYGSASLSAEGKYLLFSVLDSSNSSSVRVMSVPLQGGPRSTLLVGNYTYRCPRLPGKSCVLAEVHGSQLVFSFLDPISGKGAEIQRMELDADYYNVQGIDWSLSPDGTRIAVGESSDKWIRILTITDHKVAPLPRKGSWGRAASIAWAADGKHLFVTAWSDHFARQAILSIDLEGNTKIIDEVQYWAFELWALRASADGRYLAYSKTIQDENVKMLENF